MKKNFLLILFFFITLNICFSQTYSHEFGKNSGDEFRLNAVDYDSTAQAVVIYDIGKVSFIPDDYGFKVLYERCVKVKLFKQGGFPFASFSIPFYSEGSKVEVVNDIVGNTYNFENNVVRTTPFNTKNIYIEKDEENVKVMKFAMPDVKEGSIIEMKYSILSPFHTRYQSWLFQNRIPVLYSEYSTTLNPIIEYKYLLQGAKDFDYFKETPVPGFKQFHGDSYSEKNYLFAMKNLPAVKDESFMPSWQDYLVRLDFRLIRYNYPNSGIKDINSSWTVIVDNFLNSEEGLGKYYAQSTDKAKKMIVQLQTSNSSQRQIAEKIERYIKSNYRWNGNISVNPSENSLSDFLESKIGNCTEVNLFFIGMLNAAGIESYPLLVSTRKHGKIKTGFPDRRNFNYVLAYVKTDSSKFILDATDPLCAFRQVPAKCLNELGLIAKKGKEASWLKFNSTINSYISTRMDFYPDPEKDQIQATVRIVAGGYDALNLREQYIKDPQEMKKELKITTYSFLDSMNVENSQDPSKDFIISFRSEFSLFSDIKDSEEKVVKRLLLSPFSDRPISENPLKEPTRTFPLNFQNKYKREFVSTFHLPPGYALPEKPENILINNDNVFIRFKTENLNDSTVKVTGIYEFKKDVYDASAYDEIKGYFNTIVERFNERLVFVKP